MGANVVEADLDSEAGERLAARLRDLSPRLIYVVPSFRNPTGYLMSAREREKVLELARALGAPVVEDGAYRELCFEEAPPPALRSLAGPGHEPPVIAVGTVSEVFTPEWLHSAPLAGHFEKLRALYRARRDAAAAALTKYLPQARFELPKGGFYLWCSVDGLDTLSLLPVALRHGTAFVPGPSFFTGGDGREWLRLSYASPPFDAIQEGIHRLAAAVTSEESARAQRERSRRGKRGREPVRLESQAALALSSEPKAP